MDMVSMALRRRLAAAEAADNDELADRIRRRMGIPEPVAPPEEVATEPPPQVPEGDGLDDVPFASTAAREAARGMSAETFERHNPSGVSGFTKADVERIAGAAGDEDE